MSDENGIRIESYPDEVGLRYEQMLRAALDQTPAHLKMWAKARVWRIYADVKWDQYEVWFDRGSDVVKAQAFILWLQDRICEMTAGHNGMHGELVTEWDDDWKEEYDDPDGDWPERERIFDIDPRWDRDPSGAWRVPPAPPKPVEG